jgi:hypothetical protein
VVPVHTDQADSGHMAPDGGCGQLFAPPLVTQAVPPLFVERSGGNRIGNPGAARLDRTDGDTTEVKA